MAYNPLRVSLENIIPLTEARDHFSQIVNEVQKDKLYVLTKGGKPAVAIIDVKYLEAISGGEINKNQVKEEIKKDPTKVGLPNMVSHTPPPPPPTPVPITPPKPVEPPKPMEPPKPIEPPKPPIPAPITPPKPVEPLKPEPPKPMEPPKSDGPKIETTFSNHDNVFKHNEPLKTPPMEEKTPGATVPDPQAIPVAPPLPKSEPPKPENHGEQKPTIVSVIENNDSSTEPDDMVID